MTPDLALRITGKNQTGQAFTSLRADMAKTGAAVTGIEANVYRLATAVSGLPMALKAGFIGAGVLAAQQLGAALLDVSREVANVKAQAETAGVSFQAFQELGYVARQNRIDIGQLTDGLKEMQLRADELVSGGGGPGAEAFARLGFTAKQLARDLEEPDKLFEQIIERLGRLDQAAQIRIADEVFGGSAGETFVRLVDEGADGIAEMRDRAKELGLALSDEAVNGAAALDQRFTEFMMRWDAWWKNAVLGTADFMTRMPNGDGPVSLLGGKGAMAGQAATAGLAQTPDEAALARLAMDLGDGRTGRLPGFDFSPFRTDFVSDGSTPSFDSLLSTFGISKPSGRSSSGVSATSEAERQAAAYQKVVTALQQEIDLIGLNARDQEKLNQIRAAGVDGASAQADTIRALVDQQYDLVAANELAAQSQELLVSAVDGVVAAWEDGIITGEEMIDILISLAKQASQMDWGSILGIGGGGGGGGNWLSALFGGGGGGGGQWGVASGFSGFSGIFGIPGMASGGVVAEGGLVKVGENGTELISLPEGAQVIPNGQSRNYYGDKAMPGIVMHNTIQMPAGAKEEDGAAFAKGFALELKRQLPDAMKAVQRNDLRR